MNVRSWLNVAIRSSRPTALAPTKIAVPRDCHQRLRLTSCESRDHLVSKSAQQDKDSVNLLLYRTPHNVNQSKSGPRTFPANFSLGFHLDVRVLQPLPWRRPICSSRPFESSLPPSGPRQTITVVLAKYSWSTGCLVANLSEFECYSCR